MSDLVQTSFKNISKIQKYVPQLQNKTLFKCEKQWGKDLADRQNMCPYKLCAYGYVIDQLGYST